jgi:hypothetical protein
MIIVHCIIQQNVTGVSKMENKLQKKVKRERKNKKILITCQKGSLKINSMIMWHHCAVRDLALVPASFKQFLNERKQESTVSILTGRGLDSPGFESWQRKYVQISSGAHQASYLMGTGVTSQG